MVGGKHSFIKVANPAPGVKDASSCADRRIHMMLSTIRNLG